MTAPFPLQQQTAPRDPSRLMACSYNIHAGIGRDGCYDPERIAAVLAEIDADVIGLQEVTARPELDRIKDQFEYFENITGLHCVAGANIVLGQGRYGNALLSRWPVINTRLVDLSIPPFEPRGAIDCDLDVNGRVVRVVVTHLGLSIRERFLQIGNLRNLLDRHDREPTIIMGDFNVWGGPERWPLWRLGARSRPRKAPASFPSDWPLLALDRIWTRPDRLLTRLAAHRSTLARMASDHLPLWARIDMTR